MDLVSGVRDAITRIAHMLCEFSIRWKAAGLGSRAGMHLPMNQQDIADATGLTSVHVNRMLRLLRDNGAIDGSGRGFRVADWSRLSDAAGFEPDYLHLAA